MTDHDFLTTLMAAIASFSGMALAPKIPNRTPIDLKASGGTLVSRSEKRGRAEIIYQGVTLHVHRTGADAYRDLAGRDFYINAGMNPTNQTESPGPSNVSKAEAGARR